MTALDDGLNTSSPVFNPPTLRAEWLALPPTYADNVTVDSIQDLGEQIGPQGLNIVQSIDDGLPDSVTMTSGNDASGTLVADLVGRPGVEAMASSLGFTAVTTGNNAGNATVPSLPGDIAFMDYCMVALTVPADEYVIEWLNSFETPTWELLGDVLDGTYRTFLFGRTHYPGLSVHGFITASGNVMSAFGWACFAVKCGRTMAGALVPVTPERAAVGAEGAVAVTSHTAPSVSLPSMGYTVGIFGASTAFGPFAVAGDAVSLGNLNTGVSMLVARSPLRTSGPLSYTMTATTAISTADVPMIHVPLVVRERPFLDAQRYFSPFDKLSPVYGFERDTAPMTAEVNVVTPEGNVATPIFNGIMNDIQISGRTATLDASSAKRLTLDRSVTVPTVNGFREGCDTDWLIGYLLACGGEYTSVCPGPNTRFWAPMHGSIHPWMDGPASYPVSTTYTTARTPGTPYANNNHRTVDGPFVSAMYAQMKSAEVIQNTIQNDPQWAVKPPGVDDYRTYDLHSKQNSAGRLSFRIRGDDFDAAPAALAGAEDWLFAFTLFNYTSGGGAGNYVRFQINSNRSITTWVGNSFNYSVASYPNYAFPSDGEWHLYGFAWNYAIGEAKIRRDGVGTASSVGYSGNLAELPNTQAALYGQGLFTGMIIQTRLPTAEIQVEFGPECWTTQPWTPTGGGWQWMGAGNPPGLNSLNCTYRPTRQPLAAVAIPAPVQGWPTLQNLAESTLSHLRINEDEHVEFLPLSYFGEPEQMEVEDLNILDTTINAAELGVVADPSKIRNLVTSEFQEVRIASSRSPILETNAVIVIPRGESFQTFALDKTTVETHGAASWQTSTPEITKLTATQIANPDTIPNEHVMTANFLPDGTGTVIASTVFQARIVSWSNSTVTIRFRNNWPATLYLANNGSQVPTLRILGYEVERTDAYATVQDPGSVGLRRQRALTTSPEWIQDRETGLNFTTQLVSIIARPRPQISVTVMGDPRRKPGQLVRLFDSTGTQATGTWRILKVAHKISGAMYVNELEVVRVGEIGLWDESLWDNAVWGE